MSSRVVVFLDYQNVYRRAREAFCDVLAPHWEGQVDPLRIGELLCTRGPQPRILQQVRVYRGRPDSSRDPKGYGAASRQCARWQRSPMVEVLLRTLRYPRTYPALPAQEKGIDVKLAVDFVTMALRGEYDVGIVMSEDTDLKPALEAVMELQSLHCEAAAWSPAAAPRRGLRLTGLWCHYLSGDDYVRVADPTDYTRP